jgi:hypothetical protein
MTEDDFNPPAIAIAHVRAKWGITMAVYYRPRRVDLIPGWEIWLKMDDDECSVMVIDDGSVKSVTWHSEEPARVQS